MMRSFISDSSGAGLPSMFAVFLRIVSSTSGSAAEKRFCTSQWDEADRSSLTYRVFFLRCQDKFTERPILLLGPGHTKQAVRHGLPIS